MSVGFSQRSVCITEDFTKVDLANANIMDCSKERSKAGRTAESLYNFIRIRDRSRVSDKEPACQCRRHKRCGLDPWLGKIPAEGNGNPLRYFCLENPMDMEAWWATVQGVEKRKTRWQRLAC